MRELTREETAAAMVQIRPMRDRLVLSLRRTLSATDPADVAELAEQSEQLAAELAAFCNAVLRSN